MAAVMLVILWSTTMKHVCPEAWEAIPPSDIVSPNFLISGPPNWVARRAHKNLLRLASLVPPRVSSAVIRTQWNSWCTACRFQHKYSAVDKCLFGCADAHDNIEHYSRCGIALSCGMAPAHSVN